MSDDNFVSVWTARCGGCGPHTPVSGTWRGIYCCACGGRTGTP